MATETREVLLPVPPPEAYALVIAAGREIPKFRPSFENPSTLCAGYAKGWGLSNPIDVNVRVSQAQDGASSVIRFEATLMALVDPFGLLTKTLDQFAGHLHNHHVARMTGAPVPPALTNEREVRVNIVAFGILGVILLGVILVVAGVALTR
jgi:hypothetical protein